MKYKERMLQEVREELHEAQEKINRLIATNHSGIDEKDHQLQEALERAIAKKKGSFILENRSRGSGGY